MADELNTNGSDAAGAAPVIETPADSAAVNEVRLVALAGRIVGEGSTLRISSFRSSN